MIRYALYFTPPPASPWWNCGCRWLGLDLVSGAVLAQPNVAGMTPDAFHDLTALPRRYGFHATLKSPFRLAAGLDETHLLAEAKLFAARQRPVMIGLLHPKPLRDIMALRPPDDAHQLNALAQRCVEHFDPLRAGLSEPELARYRDADLAPRQQELLMRWGYPYTEEAFRFHLTLTGSTKNIAVGQLSTLYAAARMVWQRIRAAAAGGCTNHHA